MAGGFETVKEDLHMLNADLFGVIMFVRNLTNAPIHASAIQKAFKRNGIEINSASVFGTGKEIEGFLTKDPNRVVIWVAQKP